jgi:multidrug efflux pump subunit AcrB
MGIGAGSFVVALGLAPLVGSEFVPQTDQGFTQLALRMPVGSSLERTDAKVQQIEPSCCTMPEVQDHVATWVGGPGQRNQAWLNIALKPRKDRSAARSRWKTPCASHRPHPRHRRQRGLRPADLRGHPGQRPRRPGAGGGRVRREGQEDPGVVDVESSVKPGLPAYAVR